MGKATSRRKPSRHDIESAQFTSLCIAENFVRNAGVLEDLHAGPPARSATGDYSDVKVVTPYGEIPWNDVSRISDEEMAALMREVVNKIFTLLRFNEELGSISPEAQSVWDPPCLDLRFAFAAVMRRERLKGRRRRRDGAPSQIAVKAKREA